MPYKINLDVLNTLEELEAIIFNGRYKKKVLGLEDINGILKDELLVNYFTVVHEIDINGIFNKIDSICNRFNGENFYRGTRYKKQIK